MGFRLNPCPLLKQEETNDHLRGIAHQSDQAIGGYSSSVALQNLVRTGMISRNAMQDIRPILPCGTLATI